MMGYYGWHPVTRNVGYLGFSAGLFSTFLFVVLIIVFLIMLFKHSNSAKNGGEDEALKILKIRYAKGEIDKKKLEEMKKDIK